VRTDLLGHGPGRSTKLKDLATTAAFAAGGLLVIWSSGIHLHLWDTGYRKIPTIGPLFLLQSIAGFALGLLILAVRRVWAAILGVGFALATMAGFLISVEHGLFGFQDSWAAPFAHQAFYIEIAIAAVMVAAGALSLVGSATTSLSRSTPAGSATSGA
jgi:hypothetical protein